MKLFACVAVVFLAGCSFWGDRVREKDVQVEKLEKEVLALKTQIRAMPEDTDERRIVAEAVADAEERLRLSRAERDRALDGKESEDIAIRGWITAVLAAAGGVLKMAGKAAV